jgi:proteasome lid subunit RPN8/RPN11
MLSSSTVTSVGQPAPSAQYVVLLGQFLDCFLDRVGTVHAAGRKSFGLLVADPTTPQFPYCATDVVFFDPAKNRRNDPAFRPAFEAQGSYFRSYDDAGFVADPAEVLQVHRHLEGRGLEAVALFHTHRRQPANFSHIDYRLHNPAYPWHLIISLRDARRPVLRAFEVRKDLHDFGIDASDDNEHSECDYPGPEVRPLPILTTRQDALSQDLALLPPERCRIAARG